MFNYIKERIKQAAEILLIIGIITSFIIGIYIISQELFIVGFVTIIVGIVLSWITSLVLYGFGELIQNSDIIAKRLCEHDESQEEHKNSSTSTSIIRKQNEDIDDDSFVEIECPYCKEDLSVKWGILQRNDTLKCPMCDKRFDTVSYKE